MVERPTRQPNPAKSEQWGALVEYLGGALKREQILGPRHDVADCFVETGSRLHQLAGLLRVPAIKAEAEKSGQRSEITRQPGKS